MQHEGHRLGTDVRAVQKPEYDEGGRPSLHYTFGGWQVGSKVYQPGSHEYEVFEVANITKIWNKILEAVSQSCDDDAEDSGPSKEKIVKYLDGYRVLDADRNELEPETDYFKVAKTSWNRLIVVFTWQQMAEMEAGEHLYYIVLPDGSEVEYTLTIW